MFDPAQPADGSALSSAVMRSQLTSLKALIDAIVTLSSAQVVSTSTLGAGSPATASVAVQGNTLRFSFGIPQGFQGSEGPQGPPFATATVDSVTTLEPGQPAFVNVSFDGSFVHFAFGIPRGNDGAQGPPGEVSQSTLDNAIASTAQNPASVSSLSQSASSFYDQSQMQQVMDKLDELLAALRRM
jgi:hypothetical protein